MTLLNSPNSGRTKALASCTASLMALIPVFIRFDIVRFDGQKTRKCVQDWRSRRTSKTQYFLFPMRHVCIMLRAMKKHLSLVLVAACLLVGCKSPGHVDPGVLSRISQGMTREQVIQAVGS